MIGEDEGAYPACMTKAAPGWYPHPTMTATRRYWDGETWTNHVTPAPTPPRQGMMKPEPPATWVLAGIVVTAIAIGLWAFGTDVANGWPFLVASVVVGVIGWVLTTAGAVALGIRAGARWVDYERQRSN